MMNLPSSEVPSTPPIPEPQGPPPQTRTGAAAAIRAALEQFSALTGHPQGTVTGARPTADGGWSILIDVVELARIPDFTSIVATYRVDVDSANEFTSCERIRRYTRGTTDL